MRRVLWIMPLGVLLVGLPMFVQAGAPRIANYLLNNFAIQILTWIALALSYDLSVGHAGTVSLAHPAFLGIGAYTAAVLATRLGTPFLLNVLAAVLLAGTVALVVSVPFFRLSDVFFAIGTLGFAFMTQIVSINWEAITRGALCITQVPRPSVGFGSMVFHISDLTGYYYLILLISTLTVSIYLATTTGRPGRALAAVRGDEGLAQVFALNPLVYKMLAFVVGGMLAALVGVFEAHRVSVVCPEMLGTFVTLNLLIIVFVGGVGNLRGVIVGAILFTVIPELARFAQTQAQLVYGVALLLVVLYAPDGIEGVLAKVFTRRSRRASIWKQHDDGELGEKP